MGSPSPKNSLNPTETQARVADASAILLGLPRRQKLKLGAEDAEQEARSRSGARNAANGSLQDHNLDPKPADETAVQGEFNYDTQSARAEVISNVEEVKRFNEELDAAGELAQSRSPIPAAVWTRKPNITSSSLSTRPSLKVRVRDWA
jgi:hypothetical protein